MKVKFELRTLISAAALVFLIEGCGNVVNPPPRLGMVKDPATGLQFGSVVDKNFVTDASFFTNKKIKVRTRNTSGDTAFDLRRFTDELRSAYAASGYEPSSGDDFGLLIDVNVMYSGQVQTNMERQFTFLGAAGGGTAWAAIGGGAVGVAAGVLAGATLGSIIGSFITDDTYIIIAQVTFGEIKEINKSRKTITFSRSPKYNYEDEDEEKNRNKRGFRKTYTTRVAVFAGGRNIPQSRIAGEVRRRLIRIVSDII